ncbi:MAG TPA: GNAT family N-acetyltransferase [Gemmatimonadaceae bacterium]|jgi:GNAT superfamily N-acetyltransferase|nr:GNAT family N-acetyltransferase [Gemmatimonadaceae bacterium]
METVRTTIAVRDAEVRDAEALARLCGELGYPSSLAEVTTRLERMVQSGARALVATSGAEVVGLATVHLRTMINHAAPLAQLTLLVVAEERRSQGVGRALVDEAEVWAKAQGCRRIIVTTALHRTGAHAFYERIGYSHTGRRYGKDFA